MPFGSYSKINNPCSRSCDDQKGGDHPGNPSAAGEDKYKQYRTAAFVDYGQWGEYDAKDYSPE